LEEESDILNSLSSLYGRINKISLDSTNRDNSFKSAKSPAPNFTPEIWQDVGCSLLYALLDYDHINPISRLV
jgi:hypothetical protein